MLFIKDNKIEYRDGVIHTIPDPEVLHMPLNTYNGTLSPVVTEGQQVLKYQVIARAEDWTGTCLHAPVSGIIGKRVDLAAGSYLELINDFRDNEEIPEEKTTLTTAAPDLLQQIQQYGIVGSGGAQFPSHIKFDVKNRITTFIINGAECEPYLTADYAVMKNFAEELAQGIALISAHLGTPKIIIGIEKHNKALEHTLLQAFEVYSVKVKIHWLPDSYPQGGELQLIKSLTGIEIPKGKISTQYGILVSNVGTLWSIYKALIEHKPYTERMVTLYDERTQSGKNYLLKVGTPVDFISAFFFEKQVTPAEGQLLLGGPMMGGAVTDMKESIHKGSGGLIFINKQKDAQNNCINCGYCTDVCPQRLLPLEFARNYQEENVLMLQNYNLKDCIECGACAYVCPSQVPLMQSIISGKRQLRNL